MLVLQYQFFSSDQILSAAAAYILAHKYTFSLTLWHTHTEIFYSQKIYQLVLDNRKLLHFMHELYFLSWNTNALINIIISCKKRLSSFGWGVNKLFTQFKEIKFINFLSVFLFNNLFTCIGVLG